MNTRVRNTGNQRGPKTVLMWGLADLTLVIVVILVLSFLPACKDAPPEPTAGIDTTSHTIVWKVDTLGTYGSALLDISAVSPTSIYAVGAIWNYNGTVPTYMIHWDGVRWIDMRDDSLRLWISGGVPGSVHALSDTAVYITSTRFETTVPLPLAACWNGKTWKNITPPTTEVITGIRARSSTEVYVVGFHGLIMRYDGSQWHAVSSPTQLDYQDIFMLPNGVIYAAACDVWNSYKGSVVVRIERGNATVEFSRGIGRIAAVGGTATNDLYAACEGVFHRGDDGTWRELTMPGDQVALWGVFSGMPNDVLVVGSFGKTIHWNGRSWHSYDELYDRSSAERFERSCNTAGRYFIVGHTATQALLVTGLPQ